MSIRTGCKYHDRPHLGNPSRYSHPAPVRSDPLPPSLPDLQRPDTALCRLPSSSSGLTLDLPCHYRRACWWLDCGWKWLLSSDRLCWPRSGTVGPYPLFVSSLPLPALPSPSSFLAEQPHAGCCLTVSAGVISSGIRLQSTPALHSTENVPKLTAVQVMRTWEIPVGQESEIQKE